MDNAVTTGMAGHGGDLKFRDWTIALAVTTAVFLVTTLLLACILFVVVCRKIAKLRKEREATRVTGVMQGMTSPHWIDHTNLNDMLSQERDSPENKPQNIWSISTQTFEQNRGVQQPSQSTSTVTSPLPVPSVHAQTADTPTTHGNTQNGSLVRSGTDSGVPEIFSRVADDGERTTPIVASLPTAATGGQDSIKPNRTAPPPPKTRKKSKEHKDADYDQEPVPYVYPMQKFMQKLKHREKGRDPGATAQSGGNQSHEYAQPHVHLQMQHDAVKQTSVANNLKKAKYQPIDPKLKQPKGQYQDLLVNGLPRGQSLPSISTFSTLS